MSLPGQIAYQLWHRPLAAVRNSYRHGGPYKQWCAARGRNEMQNAAAMLPSLPPRNGVPFTVHLLTGRRFAYQTAFCLHSLGQHCPVPLAVELYDDGSLAGEGEHLLRRIAPGALVHNHAILKERLESYLPINRYPVLRERWINYPHLRKLIDVHLGRSGWRLVLDSDLLFWREPRFLLDWASTQERPLHAVDCIESYGYSRPLLERVAGAPLPPLVNVGLCGLRSESLDWDFLEHASATLIAAASTSYYLEQALVAILAAREPGGFAIAPVGDYLTLPSRSEINSPTAVMHHYVDTSRDAYHTTAWRHTLRLR